jgi:hypothetical protein
MSLQTPWGPWRGPPSPKVLRYIFSSNIKGNGFETKPKIKIRLVFFSLVSILFTNKWKWSDGQYTQFGKTVSHTNRNISSSEKTRSLKNSPDLKADFPNKSTKQWNRRPLPNPHRKPSKKEQPVLLPFVKPVRGHFHQQKLFHHRLHWNLRKIKPRPFVLRGNVFVWVCMFFFAR